MSGLNVLIGESRKETKLEDIFLCFFRTKIELK